MLSRRGGRLVALEMRMCEGISKEMSVTRKNKKPKLSRPSLRMRMRGKDSQGGNIKGKASFAHEGRRMPTGVFL